ncbi:hypothetical protein MRX96_021580 [Rhipicephalus microplus]
MSSLTGKSFAKAKTLPAAVSDGELIIATACLSNLLAYTLPLSRLYQKECVHVHTARNTLTDTVAALNAQRRSKEEAFTPLYEQAIALTNELETELSLPRITKRQSHRSNTPALDPVQFLQDISICSTTG